MTTKEDPRSELNPLDTSMSPYVPSDFVDTPYPPEHAITPKRAGRRPGGFADWTFDTTVTDEYGNRIEVHVSWSRQRISIRWSILKLSKAGEVWIGFGAASDRTSERCYSAGPSHPGLRSWAISSPRIPFDPTVESWWFEIAVVPEDLSAIS